MSISIIVANHCTATRRGISNLLEAHKDWKIVADANNSVDAVRLAQLLRPTIIMLDIGLRPLDGLEAAGRIREMSSRTHLLMFSAHATRDLVERAFLVGVGAFLLMQDAEGDLEDAICALMRGMLFTSSSFSQELCIRAQRKKAELLDSRPTLRETQVIEFVGQWTLK